MGTRAPRAQSPSRFRTPRFAVAPPQTPPAPPAASPPVYADHREPDAIVRLLRAEAVPVDVRALQPADFVVGDVAIERKTVSDVAASVYDGRLFDQVQRIKSTYPSALLVVEGDCAGFDAFANPRALWGALLSVALDWETPVLPTASEEQTARLLATLWRRLGKEPRAYALRHKPRAYTPEQEAMLVVQGLPAVGDKLSERLLDHFGAVRKVMNAREGDLQRVPGVGPEKARRIVEVLDRPWRSRQARLEEGDEG